MVIGSLLNYKQFVSDFVSSGHVSNFSGSGLVVSPLQNIDYYRLDMSDRTPSGDKYMYDL